MMPLAMASATCFADKFSLNESGATIIRIAESTLVSQQKITENVYPEGMQTNILIKISRCLSLRFQHLPEELGFFLNIGCNANRRNSCARNGIDAFTYEQ